MFTTLYHLTRQPIFASDREVIRAARDLIAPQFRRGDDGGSKAARFVVYRGILNRHHEARELVTEFRL